MAQPFAPVGAGMRHVRNQDQFDPGPPLRLDSPKYRRALAEVEYIGAANSPRTAEQTEVANFWYPAVNFAYVHITRAVLADTNYRLSWQARFVAAFNVITTDAQISIYNAKYKYLFWRPSNAITTGNYLQDPTWTSFWAAPQHSEYPSGHGGQVGSQQGILDAFLGPRAPAPIPLTSPDALGVTRTYTDWKTITDDVINARVWGACTSAPRTSRGSTKACASPAGKLAASRRSACKTRCL